MEEHLSMEEAWKDFYAWIKKSDMWSNIMRHNKQYLSSLNKAVKDGIDVDGRIASTLNRYAPGRYQFHSVNWVTKKTAPE